MEWELIRPLVKLKGIRACAICGGRDLKAVHNNESLYLKNVYGIECKCGNIEMALISVQKVIKKWNRRQEEITCQRIEEKGW